ncbi:MAG: hypothetical protein ABI664_16090 [bacterium]
MLNIIAALALPLAVATSPAPVTTDSADMTLVVVDNDRGVAVTVYEEDSFGDFKLGVVAPNSQATLRMKDYIIYESQVQFFVVPKGELEESAPMLDVRRGERVGLVVPARR